VIAYNSIPYNFTFKFEMQDNQSNNREKNGDNSKRIGSLNRASYKECFGEAMTPEQKLNGLQNDANQENFNE
jgi:hypothetical protein